jgi:multiple sugar transport system substrate-binding protein
MYDPLYLRLSDFEEQEGITVEVAASLPHPELNDRVEEEFSSEESSYDLISTHVKYAPSQAQWLSPLDEDLDEGDLQHFSPLTLELARIGGSLYGVPRMLDVKLLLYRTDLLSSPSRLLGGATGRGRALAVRRDVRVRLPRQRVWPLRPLFELHAMAGGQMFEGEGPPVPRLNDEAGRWALGLLKDLYERAAPEETPEWHYDEVAACFREGRAAMSTDWPGGFYTYEEEGSAVADRFDVALYPEGKAGASSTPAATPSRFRTPRVTGLELWPSCAF